MTCLISLGKHSKHPIHHYREHASNFRQLRRLCGATNLWSFEGHTSDSIGGSPPASNNKTFQFGFSDNLEATTEPAEPAPTTMKSYGSKPETN